MHALGTSSTRELHADREESNASALRAVEELETVHIQLAAEQEQKKRIVEMLEAQAELGRALTVRRRHYHEQRQLRITHAHTIISVATGTNESDERIQACTRKRMARHSLFVNERAYSCAGLSVHALVIHSLTVVDVM